MVNKSDIVIFLLPKNGISISPKNLILIEPYWLAWQLCISSQLKIFPNKCTIPSCLSKIDQSCSATMCQEIIQKFVKWNYRFLTSFWNTWGNKNAWLGKSQGIERQKYELLVLVFLCVFFAKTEQPLPNLLNKWSTHKLCKCVEGWRQRQRHTLITLSMTLWASLKGKWRQGTSWWGKCEADRTPVHLSPETVWCICTLMFTAISQHPFVSNIVYGIKSAIAFPTAAQEALKCWMGIFSMKGGLCNIQMPLAELSRMSIIIKHHPCEFLRHTMRPT